MHLFFVDVILPVALNQTFTYQISEAEYNFIQKGCRVVVPFGKSKVYTGLAYNLHQTPPILYTPKEIIQILDVSPIVLKPQLDLWQWMSNYYMCSLGEVFRAALPNHFLLESESMVKRKSWVEVNEHELSDDEFLVYQALLIQSSLSVKEVAQILNKKKVIPVIEKLIQKDILQLEDEIVQKYKPKEVKYIRLNPDFDSEKELTNLLNQLGKSPKQRDLLLHFFQWKAVELQKPLSAKNLLERANGSSGILKSLIDKNILQAYFLIEDRTDFSSDEPTKTILLSEKQNIAFEEIQEVFKTKDTCLLFGVTSSGKTEVYVKLIQEQLTLGNQVLFLLPEIALTTQLVSRLRLFFGNTIAVFHSKYSANERVEVWNQVLEKSDKAQVIIGARSAIFLPFSNLGLIIVDEEHEATFKQSDPAPRYHARDSAAVLGQFLKAKLLLGSATPSIETFYNTQNNKYGLVQMTERYGNAVLPDISLVDLKDKYFRKQMVGHFSHELIHEIAAALNRKEQVILFQNRRGYAPVLECTTCGHVPQCPQCDVSLTFHKFKNQLRCHYCGHSIAKPSHCHACSSVDLTTKGFGTEQIEIELASLFPTHKIARMDYDTTRGKDGYDNILDRFQNRSVDILVGTQMLAKGLDFEHVSLVGILNADNMLYHPDFRAYERSFQMMTQVSGRAGRSTQKGKVIIQTYNPSHSIIEKVVQNDYLGMFEEQLHERYLFQYPPYYRLVKITLRHKDFEKLRDAANWLNQMIRAQLPIPILGPEEPAINRIRNLYIREIIVKIPADQSVGNVKNKLRRILASFDAVSQFKSIRVTLNVDVY
jgi:primosomal protein N' (replication factor Y)